MRRAPGLCCAGWTPCAFFAQKRKSKGRNGGRGTFGRIGPFGCGEVEKRRQERGVGGYDEEKRDIMPGKQLRKMKHGVMESNGKKTKNDGTRPEKRRGSVF